MYRLISSAISYSRSRLTVISCAGFVGSFPSSTAMCGGPFPQSLPTHSSPGDDVHVEVWCVLSCNDTVILNEIQAFRIVRSDESVGHPSHGPHDGDCLVVRQIKESWGVTSGDDVDLPMLKLLPVDRCHSLLGLLRRSPCPRVRQLPRTGNMGRQVAVSCPVARLRDWEVSQ